MTLAIEDAAKAAISIKTAAPRAHTIAVTSGKGGVGKTNISVNLAAMLAAQQRRVILLDADLGLANADILCGIRAPFNLAHVIAGQKRMREILVPVRYGFSLVAGASGLSRMADLRESQRRTMLTELNQLHELADILIFDTGAGIGRDVLSFTTAADQVLLVTTPEPTAMMDAYAVLKVLAHHGATAKTSMIVNQARNRDEARCVHQNIIGVAQRFLKAKVDLAGYVLADPAVGLAVRQRQAFAQAFPQSPAGQSMSALANHIDRQIHDMQNPQDAKSGFFARLAAWWG